MDERIDVWIGGIMDPNFVKKSLKNERVEFYPIYPLLNGDYNCIIYYRSTTKDEEDKKYDL